MSTDTTPDWSDLLELDGAPTALRPDRVAADREAQIVADAAESRRITGNRGALPVAAIGAVKANPSLMVPGDEGYLSHPMEARAAIRACESMDALASLAPSFRTLPDALRANLREAYRERSAFLRSQTEPTDPLQAVAAEVTAEQVNATRGVVGLTAADVNPVANMANAAAQAAVTYLDGQALQDTANSSAIVPVLASEGVEGGYAPTPEALAQVEAIRARQAARGRRVAPAVLPAPADSGNLTRGAIVAGAAAEGFGALVSWDGLREQTRATHLAIAKAHGVEPLKPQSLHAQLGVAVRGWNQRGYVVRATMRTKGAAGYDFKVRYVIGTPNFKTGDDSLGDKVLTVTLENDGATVTYDAHTSEGSALVPGIKAEVERLCAGEVYKAGAITDWLVGYLSSQHAAVRCWGGYYVRRASVPAVEAFLQAVKDSGWGRNWGLPALPIATSAQLLSGLSNGLIEECNAVLAELDAKRHAAIEAGKLDVSPGTAAALLVKLDKVSEKCKAHAELLGSAHVADVQRCINECRETLRPLADDTSQRFANIADEIGLGR